MTERDWQAHLRRALDPQPAGDQEGQNSAGSAQTPPAANDMWAPLTLPLGPAQPNSPDATPPRLPDPPPAAAASAAAGHSTAPEPHRPAPAQWEPAAQANSPYAPGVAPASAPASPLYPSAGPHQPATTAAQPPPYPPTAPPPPYQSPPSPGLPPTAQPYAPAQQYPAPVPPSAMPGQQQPAYRQESRRPTGVTPAPMPETAIPDPTAAAVPGPPNTGTSPADIGYVARHVQLHGDPAWRRARDAARAVLGRQSSRDVAELTAAAQGANRPITTGRRVAVVSVRGGAGKSTVSALLATTLAGLRPDPVLAVDADTEPGSLPLRLGPLGDGVRTSADRGIDQAREFDRVTRGLHRTVSRVWLWRQAHAATLHRVGEAAAVELLRDRQRYLSRFFAVLVTDCGPGLTNSVNRVVIGDAHAIVIAGTATLDGVHGVDTALQRLATGGGPLLLGRCVVTITTTNPGPLGVNLDDAVARFQAYGAPVIVFPHDRQLALGGPIDVSRLSGGARAASVRLAAAVMDKAVAAGAIE